MPAFIRCVASRRAVAIFVVAAPVVGGALGAGGPLGIDHRLSADDANGIWNRHHQRILQTGTVLAVAGSALWEGSDSRFGRTAWQSVDSLVLGAVTSSGLKLAFSRARPTQSESPNRWFQGRGHYSFPSGEVMTVTTAVTPFVLEYGAEHPAVWALELLPVYDAVARVHSRAHWQSDVLASFFIGSAIGAFAHSRAVPISVGVLPRGITIGWKTSF